MNTREWFSTLIIVVPIVYYGIWYVMERLISKKYKILIYEMQEVEYIFITYILWNVPFTHCSCQPTGWGQWLLLGRPVEPGRGVLRRIAMQRRRGHDDPPGRARGASPGRGERGQNKGFLVYSEWSLSFRVRDRSRSRAALTANAHFFSGPALAYSQKVVSGSFRGMRK